MALEATLYLLSLGSVKLHSCHSCWVSYIPIQAYDPLSWIPENHVRTGVLVVLGQEIEFGGCPTAKCGSEGCDITTR